jgi:hypothetical protein
MLLGFGCITHATPLLEPPKALFTMQMYKRTFF